MFQMNQGPRIGQPVWPGAILTPGQTLTNTTQPITQASLAAGAGASVVVRVLDPGRKPVEGVQVTAYAVPVHGSRYAVEEGMTDSTGIWRFDRNPVPSEDAYRYDLVVQPGSETVRFPAKETTAPPDRPSKRTVVICPAGIDPLVCEVASLQEIFRETYNVQMEKWNDMEFASRMAHAAVRNSPTEDPRLEPFVNNKSYGVSDLGIPPGDWPDIVKYWDQTQHILNNIPWPMFTGQAEKISYYFRACALGVPVTTGRNGKPLVVGGFRLYSPTWSDFFPKKDREIREIFAASWAMNMLAIGRCIEHRIKKKARDVERAMKMNSTLGLIASFLVVSHFAGVATVAIVVASEAVDHYRIYTQDSISEDVAKALPEITETLAQPNLTTSGAIVGILGTLIGLYIGRTDLSPAAKAVLGKAVPAVIDLAVEEIVTVGASEGVTASALSDGIIGALAKALGSAIRAEGIKGAKELGRAILGYRTQVESVMIPFQLWLLRTLLVGKIVELAAEEAGIDDFDAEEDLYQVAEAQAEETGTDVPASAKAPASSDTSGPVATSDIESVAAAGGGLLLLGLVAGIIGS